MINSSENPIHLNSSSDDFSIERTSISPINSEIQNSEKELLIIEKTIKTNNKPNFSSGDVNKTDFQNDYLKDSNII